MLFEWDEAKRKKNLIKHGIDLALADDMDWVTAIIKPDSRKEYGENRYVALGFIGDRLYSCAWTIRANVIRVISLRKANRREELSYEEEIEAFNQ